jgi:hypothetical protein
LPIFARPWRRRHEHGPTLHALRGSTQGPRRSPNH